MPLRKLIHNLARFILVGFLALWGSLVLAQTPGTPSPEVQTRAGDTGAKESIAPAYRRSDEIQSWAKLAMTCQKDSTLTNLKGFVDSLQGKDPKDVAKALAKVASDMASALKKLQDEEVKWQKLRAQSTP